MARITDILQQTTFYHSNTGLDQTSVNLGPDSRFVLETFIKALISKSSRCSILKTHNHLQLIPDSQPDSSLPDSLIFHTSIHDYLSVCLIKAGKCEAQNVKANYWCVHSNTQIPDRYSTLYSTWNKGRLSSYFWITIPGRVIRQSLD